ncbi:MAG: hypothetical protein PHU75_09410 [Candidatus Nanopelagicales bacterium]|nr:hypothetical protein [Candidatus Nanopelagicales bacterium]
MGAIELTDTTAIRAEITTWAQAVAALKITSEPTYRDAAEMLLNVRAIRGRVNATFDPVIEAAHKSHKAALAAKAEHEAPLATAERAIKGMMSAYMAEQERLRLAEQSRLAAIARQEEEDRRLAEAQAAQDAGDAEMAEALIAQPVVVQPVKAAPAVPKIAGVVYRTTWRAEVVDLAALVRFVAATPAFANLVLANMPALNSLATAQKGAMAIPGVRAVSETR